MNVAIPGYNDLSLQEKLSEVVDPFVFEYIKNVRGSVSAEHGIGL